jgi:hypothetical protein
VGQSGGTWPHCKSNMWKILKFKNFEFFFIESYHFYLDWTMFYKSHLFCYKKAVQELTYVLESKILSVLYLGLNLEAEIQI